MGPFSATYAIFFVDWKTMTLPASKKIPPEDAEWIKTELLTKLNIDLDQEWMQYWMEIPPGSNVRESIDAFWDYVRGLLKKETDNLVKTELFDPIEHLEAAGFETTRKGHVLFHYDQLVNLSSEDQRGLYTYLLHRAKERVLQVFVENTLDGKIVSWRPGWNDQWH